MIADWLEANGPPVERVPFDEWLERTRDLGMQSALYPFLRSLDDRDLSFEDSGRVACSATLDRLSRLSASLRPPTEAGFRRMLARLGLG